MPPEDRSEPLHVLQEHRLPLPVRADDRVVKGHRQLDDRVEPRERPVAREHLLDGHPRMPGPEDVDQASGQDRLGEPLAAALTDRGELGRFDRVQVVADGPSSIDSGHLRRRSSGRSAA